jgi:hypothetical protein
MTTQRCTVGRPWSPATVEKLARAHERMYDVGCCYAETSSQPTSDQTSTLTWIVSGLVEMHPPEDCQSIDFAPPGFTDMVHVASRS